MAVIGAGRMGTAAAMDLAGRPGVTELVVADADPAAAERAAARCRGRARVTARLDTDLHGCAAAVSAVPYQLAPRVAAAALDAGCHLVDLGGSPPATEALLALDGTARARGVALVPDLGLAPGLTNLLAHAAARELDPGCEVRIRVGGLPQDPQPPLEYRCVFSARGLLNEYLGAADVIRDGAPTTAPAMTELEEDEYPELGRLEAFLTVGGLSTLARSLAGHVRALDEKTLRYPGHCARVRLLLDLGLASEAPVAVDGRPVPPRAVLEAVLERALPDDGRDLVVARVEAEGTRRGAPVRVRYTMLDRADPVSRLSAMQRTTAFPAAAVAWHLATGAWEFRGARPAETWVPVGPLCEDLSARGVVVRREN